jgi:hypothetical protein
VTATTRFVIIGLSLSADFSDPALPVHGFSPPLHTLGHHDSLGARP